MLAVVAALRAGIAPDTLHSMVEAAFIALQLTNGEGGSGGAATPQVGARLLLLPDPGSAGVAVRSGTPDAAPAPDHDPVSRGVSGAELATTPEALRKPWEGREAAGEELGAGVGDSSATNSPKRAGAGRGEAAAAAAKPGSAAGGRISLRIKLKHGPPSDSPAGSGSGSQEPLQGCPLTAFEQMLMCQHVQHDLVRRLAIDLSMTFLSAHPGM
jgi:hypothetical protein